MCLILFSYQVHADYPLVIAANRDEFYQRPTQAAHFWPEAPQLLAGKDLQAGGSWMGVNRNGRFAAVTNYRDPKQEGDFPLSRGGLVKDFLLGKDSVEQYIAAINPAAGDYAGFNLLLGNLDNLYFYSNQSRDLQQLSPGTYGLSNGHLDEPWPKVVEGKAELEAIIAEGPDETSLIHLLANRSLALDEVLPNTGVDCTMEKILSARFIQVKGYGTRSSTVMQLNQEQQVFVAEHYFDKHGNPEKEQRFQFQLLTS